MRSQFNPSWLIAYTCVRAGCPSQVPSFGASPGVFLTGSQPCACAHAVPQFQPVGSCAGQGLVLPLPFWLQGELLLYNWTKCRHRTFHKSSLPCWDRALTLTKSLGKQRKLQQRTLQVIVIVTTRLLEPSIAAHHLGVSCLGIPSG